MTFELTRKHAYQIIRELNEFVFEGEVPVELLVLDVLDRFEPCVYSPSLADREAYGVEFPQYYGDYLDPFELNYSKAYDTIANAMGRVILSYNEAIKLNRYGDVLDDYQDHPLFQYYLERARKYVSSRTGCHVDMSSCVRM